MRLSEIKKEVKKITGCKNENEMGFIGGTLLFSALSVGTSVRKLTKFTGFPAKEVKWRVKNLRQNGVFTRNGKICHGGWDDKESGGVAFIMDSLIAEGMVRRSSRCF